jgi:hypothetical protein
MAENGNGSVKKLTTWPINLQSLAQSLGLLGVLVGGVVYADRRITTLEMNYQFQTRQAEEQKALIKESMDKLNRSLENQERMLREVREANDNRRRR